MQLNKYFKRQEFACQCNCGFDTVDTALLDIVTSVRKHFDKPVTVTSGCRCKKHNEACGGATESYHLFGKAADIKVKDVTPSEVMAYLKAEYKDRYGFIEYSTWVHVDCRDVTYRSEL